MKEKCSHFFLFFETNGVNFARKSKVLKISEINKKELTSKTCGISGTHLNTSGKIVELLTQNNF